MFIVWTLWWPMLYITLLFSARAWCGFLCPLSLVNQYGNKLRKGKTINFVKWEFIAYILFFLVIIFEQVSGMFLSTQITLIVFIFLFLLAFIMGLLFQRHSFCNIVCPIGAILGIFSRLSFIGVRVKKKICRTCRDKPCLGGGKVEPCPLYNYIPELDTNQNCLLCTNCIKNCPYDSANLQFVSPTEELTRSVKFKLAESLFIIALLAFTTTLTTAGTKFYRILNLGLTGNLLRVSDLVIAILLFFIIYYIITFISSKINGKQFKDNLKDDGYVYLPLTFAILSYTIIIGFLNPWLNVNQSLLSIIKYSVILLGGLWSLDVLHERAKKYIEMLPHAILIIGIALLWLFMLIPQAPDGMGEDIYQVVSGEIIKMDAFSMGFSPSTLMAKKGDKIILEIINKDITHAFDIDIFNIHEILKPGEVKMVEFVADTKGVFQFYCQVPGHSEAGMNGKLMIT